MKIVHVIDSLALGGTENQFLSLLPDLARDHELVLVTLKHEDRPGLGELPVSARHAIGFSGPRSLPLAALRLRKIIRRERPDLVRSQLYWSSVAARLATPRAVPLIFSIHSTMSEDGYLKRREALWLEKATYRPHHRLISVSRHALDDFDRYVGLKGPADVLTNFVDPRFVTAERRTERRGAPMRLVAVGNLKPVKNYRLLIEALRRLSDVVQVDIFGEGSERGALERLIAQAGAPVHLMGSRERMWEVLPSYDAFIMPSHYEGCPNAVIEAMACGLPLLLSDIPVMHEVSRGNALFFDRTDPRSLAELLTTTPSRETELDAMAARGTQIVASDYLKRNYLERLNAIYTTAVATRDKASDGER